jgi:hypothetical protein
LVVVTHNPRVARAAGRTVAMLAGRLAPEPAGAPVPA